MCLSIDRLNPSLKNTSKTNTFPWRTSLYHVIRGIRCTLPMLEHFIFKMKQKSNSRQSGHSFSFEALSLPMLLLLLQPHLRSQSFWFYKSFSVTNSLLWRCSSPSNVLHCSCIILAATQTNWKTNRRWAEGLGKGEPFKDKTKMFANTEIFKKAVAQW